MTATLKVCNSYLHVPLPTEIDLKKNALQNIRYFKQQWKYHCIATGLDKMPEDVKISVLYLSVGRETYSLIVEKLKLDTNPNITAEKILEILEDHFLPKENVVKNRFIFNHTVQENNESIHNYLERLRKLVSLCDYKEESDIMIRDRFISGIQDATLKNELSSDPELTLEKALNKCLKNGLKRTITNEDKFDKLSKEPIKELNVDVVSMEKNTETIECDTEEVIRKKSNENESPIVNKLQETSKEFGVGSFIVLKKDFNKEDDPPIWKIDGAALLQKYVPFQSGGQTVYKNTTVYSGWKTNNKSMYYPAPVVFTQMSKKDHVIRFKKELVKKD